jgi:hypothetical protein
MSAVQLAAEFVRKDEDLKRIAQQIVPVRKQRKQLYDTLLHALEAEEVPARQMIDLGGGRVVRLKPTEGPVPVKEEYVAQRLQELLGLAEAQAQEVAAKIWSERPRQLRHRLVYEGAASSSSTGPRKRARASQAAAAAAAQ